MPEPKSVGVQPIPQSPHGPPPLPAPAKVPGRDVVRHDAPRDLRLPPPGPGKPQSLSS